MGVLKYSGRGKPIWAEGLALSQDPRLLAAFKAYTTPTNGSPGLAPFATLILMIGELIDEFQIGERASEYAVIFNQINAITAAEGAISGTNGYSGPYIMDYMVRKKSAVHFHLIFQTRCSDGSLFDTRLSTLCSAHYFVYALFNVSDHDKLGACQWVEFRLDCGHPRVFHDWRKRHKIRTRD